jgi:hypothetical protein
LLLATLFIGSIPPCGTNLSDAGAGRQAGQSGRLSFSDDAFIPQRLCLADRFPLAAAALAAL